MTSVDRTTAGPAEEGAGGTQRETESRPWKSWQKRGRPALPPGEKAIWEVRESLWLEMVRNGHRTNAIAVREGLSPRRIQLGVSRARRREEELRKRASRIWDVLPSRDSPLNTGLGDEDRDPNRPPLLIPLFPVGAFTPQSTCPHHGPIREGSAFCCMVCNRSGMDAHPALKRDPRTDPKPERKAPEAGGETRKPKPTRKQRRKQAREAAQVGPPTPADPGLMRAS